MEGTVWPNELPLFFTLAQTFRLAFVCFTHRRTSDRLMDMRNETCVCGRSGGGSGVATRGHTAPVTNNKTTEAIVKLNSSIFQRHFPNSCLFLNTWSKSGSSLRLFSPCSGRVAAAGINANQFLSLCVEFLEFTKMFFHTLVPRKCFCFPRNGISSWFEGFFLVFLCVRHFRFGLGGVTISAIVDVDGRTTQIENCFVLLRSLVLTRFQFRSVCVTANGTSFHELFIAIRLDRLRQKFCTFLLSFLQSKK